MAIKTLIVAGITRSGLTATMQMLNAGGYPCYGEYPAFENYEIGQIDFKEAQGKAIKLVDTQHQFPPTGEYYVIRLRRNQDQQVKSIVKFMRNLCGVVVDKRQTPIIKKGLNPDYKKIDDWAKRQKGFIIIDFEDIINKPLEVAEKIKSFIGCELDVEAMAGVILKRTPECTQEFHELKFIKNA